MSGAIATPLRGTSGHTGWRREASGGVGCLFPTLGRNSMNGIGWRRERRVRRVFSGDFPGGRKTEKPKH